MAAEIEDGRIREVLKAVVFVIRNMDCPTGEALIRKLSDQCPVGGLAPLSYRDRD